MFIPAPALRFCLLALLPGLAVLVASGCARGGGPDPIRTEVRVPVTQDSGTGVAPPRRTIPWAGETLRAAVRYGVREDEEAHRPVGETPGLRVARERLQAREAARRELGAMLAGLPAADPPPGEREVLTLEEFSRRRSGLDEFIARQIEQGTREEARGGPREGGMLLEMELPLAPLAAEVVRHGGGFRAGGEYSFERQAIGRAQAEAVEQARRELLETLLLREPVSGLTIAEWAQQSEYNRRQVLTATNRVAVLRSELEEEPDGEAWVVELEFDPAELESVIRQDYRERTPEGVNTQ